MLYISLAIVFAALMAWDYGRRHLQGLRAEELAALRDQMQQVQGLAAEVNIALHAGSASVEALQHDQATTDAAVKQLGLEWRDKFAVIERTTKAVEEQLTSKFGGALAAIRQQGFNR